MKSLEALILFDLLTTHHATRDACLAVAPDRRSDRAVAARHAHCAVQRDLYAALHAFAPDHRLAFADGRRVAADDEGGLIWRR